MNGFLNTLINWSEVWSLIIPLTVIIIYRPKDAQVKPYIVYVFIALLLNTMATIMVEYYHSMPSNLKNNNILYNLHSITRMICFTWYFILISPRRQANLYKLMLSAYLALVIINFAFFESIFFLSSRLFVTESIALLVLCILFYLRSIRDESETNWVGHPSFLFITGISLFEAISFFIFLFFYPLAETNPEFGNATITMHLIAFTVLCILIAIGLYRSVRDTEYKQHKGL